MSSLEKDQFKYKRPLNKIADSIEVHLNNLRSHEGSYQPDMEYLGGEYYVEPSEKNRLFVFSELVTSANLLFKTSKDKEIISFSKKFRETMLYSEHHFEDDLPLGKIKTSTMSMETEDNSLYVDIDYDFFISNVKTPEQFLLWYIANAIILDTYIKEGSNYYFHITRNNTITTETLIHASEIFRSKIGPFLSNLGYKPNEDDKELLKKLFILKMEEEPEDSRLN